MTTVTNHAAPPAKDPPASTTPSETTSSSHPTPSTTSSTESEATLFSTDLISPTISAQLPATYTLRALRKSDYQRGFLDCLRVLTVVGDITEEQWDERYAWMEGQGKGGYYLLVIDDGERVVGTGALIVERKLYVQYTQVWPCRDNRLQDYIVYIT